MERQQSGTRASVDGCPEIVSTVRRPCYGVESTRLNPGMDTNPPTHMPFEEFDYGTTGYDDGNDDDDDNENDKNEMCFNAQQLDQLITTTLFPGIDNTASPAVVHALMEHSCK
ncbi:hypothetical protein MHU86_16493 [Fragilaria crotonensis]|nr:hypothetical protein MHU86_16493 [Fragilaria crotonensis]